MLTQVFICQRCEIKKEFKSSNYSNQRIKIFLIVFDVSDHTNSTRQFSFIFKRFVFTSKELYLKLKSAKN